MKSLDIRLNIGVIRQQTTFDVPRIAMRAEVTSLYVTIVIKSTMAILLADTGKSWFHNQYHYNQFVVQSVSA